MNFKIVLVAVVTFAVAVTLGQIFKFDPGETESVADKGRKVFGLCVNCHSMADGDHRSGPSLAGIIGRRAGTASGFGRYSPALKNAGITWTAENMGRYLADPSGFLPGNLMVFAGIADARQRSELITYLAEARPDARNAPGSSFLKRADLTQSDPETRIISITQCGDEYSVVTASGAEHKFWEFNLRFKTDGSKKGPPAGRPALIPSGSSGDRAYVVFAAPGEISAFITRSCDK